MYLPPHKLAERCVHELVAGEAAAASKLARDDTRGEVGVVGRFHLHLGAGKAGTDQARDFFRIHWCNSTWAAPSRRTGSLEYLVWRNEKPA